MGRHLGQLLIHCGKCAEVLRPAQLDGAPAVEFRPAPPDARHRDQQAPPESWFWIGYVKLDDGQLYPVAYAKSPADCFALLEYYPARTEMLVCPAEPVHLGGR